MSEAPQKVIARTQGAIDRMQRLDAVEARLDELQGFERGAVAQRNDPTRGQRIADAMAEISTVGQDARNPHEGFEYASKARIYGAIRPILAKHGLRIRRRQISSSYEPTEVKTRGGVAYYLLTLEVEFALAAPLDGAGAALEWELRTHHHMVTNVRNEQALRSYMQRYWLEDSFLVDTGHPEEDVDGQDPPDFDQRREPDHRQTPPERPATRTVPAASQRPAGSDVRDAINRIMDERRMTDAQRSQLWLDFRSRLPELLEHLRENTPQVREDAAGSTNGAPPGPTPAEALLSNSDRARILAVAQRDHRMTPDKLSAWAGEVFGVPVREVSISAVEQAAGEAGVELDGRDHAQVVVELLKLRRAQ